MMRNVLVNAALAVGSIVIAFGALEGGARLLWPAEDIGACYIDHPRYSYIHRPNCERRIKLPESARVTYRYDSCGYRNDGPCLPPRPGMTRIVALGDSFTHGDLVEGDETYISVAGRALSKTAASPVDVRNLGVSGYDLVQYWARMDEALSLAPKIVTVGLLPNDLFLDLSKETIARRFRAIAEQGGKAENARRNEQYRKGLLDRLRLVVNQSRLAFAFQHFLFQNRETYVRFYLVRGAAGGYLSKEYSQEWEARMRDAERLLGEMAERARQAGARLVVVSIPQRVQVAMLGLESVPEGFDPEAFGKRIKAMGERLGTPVIDFLDELKRHPDAEKFYFPVDGHLTPAGHRLLGEFVARQLLASGALPTGDALTQAARD